ncbi:TraV family lipoprotein [Aliivibrio fischeri]|uniref:TraV family lipoprotein n=1 Tax=Aliivibrio fischeri TaxID=668 RepID=UPI0012D90DE4|nr:TraV family lipoprotein [Aliivibrio fischeri]MUJ20378.1 TraV family lipoprotein [Aliivibrio fischeri]
MINYKKTLLALSVLSLSGCSIMGVGEEPPKCGADGQGIACVSTRDVWGATDKYSDLVGMTAEEVKAEAEANDQTPDLNPAKQRALESQTKSSSNEVNNSEVGDSSAVNLKYNNYPTPQERAAAYGRFQNERFNMPSADPLAVRETPDILRVTIAPYIDDNDHLRMPVQSFIEVEKRTWIVGEKASKNTRVLTPVNIRTQSASAARVNGNKPVDSNGMGVETRPPQAEYDFSGMVPDSPSNK